MNLLNKSGKYNSRSQFLQIFCISIEFLHYFTVSDTISPHVCQSVDLSIQNGCYVDVLELLLGFNFKKRTMIFEGHRFHKVSSPENSCVYTKVPLFSMVPYWNILTSTLWISSPYLSVVKNFLLVRMSHKYKTDLWTNSPSH